MQNQAENADRLLRSIKAHSMLGLIGYEIVLAAFLLKTLEN
ncbi:MAG: hypothetical protein QGM50_03160 [Anaerolineae bacterium]|nr:hypothetical protein [Anaerolineae bacterium]MDK1081611.1 hypothetical protein [Anaerolineae bacterium]MDK1117770.1 hypothetical protein [Anaerolineae bacterium]